MSCSVSVEPEEVTSGLLYCETVIITDGARKKPHVWGWSCVVKTAEEPSRLRVLYDETVSKGAKEETPRQ